MSRLLRTGAPVFVGVNPIEYHGPHLSLHNDGIIARRLAEETHKRLLPNHPEWPFLFACELTMGVEPATGPGSSASSYLEVRSRLERTLHALADLGARHIVVMTFHGSPLHSIAIEDACIGARARGAMAHSPFNTVLRDVLEFNAQKAEAFADAVAHVKDARERRLLLENLHLDFHAGFFETSVALHLAPESVDPCYAELADCPTFAPKSFALRLAALAEQLRASEVARDLRFIAWGMGWQDLRGTPGYTGAPRHASAQAGAVFVESILSGYAELLEKVSLGGKPVAPAMQWLKAASLSGLQPSFFVPRRFSRTGLEP